MAGPADATEHHGHLPLPGLHPGTCYTCCMCGGMMCGCAAPGCMRVQPADPIVMLGWHLDAGHLVLDRARADCDDRGLWSSERHHGVMCCRRWHYCRAAGEHQLAAQVVNVVQGQPHPTPSPSLRTLRQLGMLRPPSAGVPWAGPPGRKPDLHGRHQQRDRGIRPVPGQLHGRGRQGHHQCERAVASWQERSRERHACLAALARCSRQSPLLSRARTCCRKRTRAGPARW